MKRKRLEEKMNLKKNVIAVITNAKDALNGVENRDETEDIANIAADLNVCISIGRDFFSMIDHHKFASIRKYLSMGLNEEKSINELAEYVKKPERAYFVLSYVRKVVLSDSVLATSMMAFIIFKISGENRDASHEEMVILNALCSMTDYDMKNMNYLCKNCVIAEDGDLSAEKKFDVDKIGAKRLNSCNITLNLLASYGIVQKSPLTIDGGDIGKMFASVNIVQSSSEKADAVLELDGEYTLTSVTELFYHYMCGMSQLYRDKLF